MRLTQQNAQIGIPGTGSRKQGDMTAILHSQLGAKNWPDAILAAQLGKAHRCTDIVMVC